MALGPNEARVWLIVALAFTGACRVQPAPVVGKACDDAHPCPGDLTCLAFVCCEPGACASDAGGSDAGASDAGAPDAGIDAGCFVPVRNDCGEAHCVTTVVGRGATATTRRFFGGLAYQPDGNALVFSEPERQRVLQLSLDDGGTRVLAGPGPCGQVADGLCSPTAVAFAPSGALYIADPGNRVVRKLEGNQLTTFVTSPEITRAGGMVVAGQSLFIANQSNLLRINLLSRQIEVLFRGFELGAINSVALGSDGGILFSAEHTLRAMNDTSDGGNTLLTGRPGNQTPGYVEGPPATARFGYLGGVAELGGELYLGDNTNNRLRVLARGSMVSSTVVGTGERSLRRGAPLESALNTPSALATNGRDLFIVSEPGFIYRYTPQTAAIVSLVGGEPIVTDGCATEVDLPSLTGLTRDVDGVVYFADTLLHSLRSVDAQGNVRTLIGGLPGLVDGVADAGRLNTPTGLAWRPRAGSARGEVLIADRGNGLIRAFDLSRNELRTLVGLTRPLNPEGYGCVEAFGAALSSARLCRPFSLALGPARSVYIADATGTKTAGRVSVYEPGVDSLSLFNQDFVPSDLATASDGGLWVVSTERSLSRIERLDATGARVSTLDFSTRCPPHPMGTGVCQPTSITTSSSAVLVSAAEAGLVGAVEGGAFRPIAGVAWMRGDRDGPGRSALFGWAEAMTDDGDGGVYVCDVGNQTIRFIAP